MKNLLIQPYLFFGGRCEEALEFYRTTLGAQLEFLICYEDSPQPLPPGTIPPDWGRKVMPATVRVGDTTLMASDGSKVGQGFAGFCLSLAAATPAEAEHAFAALALDGQVRMPLTQTFWSPGFGMLTDRFGIGWMVTVRA